MRGSATERGSEGYVKVVVLLGIDWEKAKAKETETESTSGSESGADTKGGEGR